MVTQTDKEPAHIVVYGNPRAQVWELEGRYAVATVRGAEEGEQGLILRDGQGLTLTHGPISRGVTESDQHDLAKERFGHRVPPRCGVRRWKAASPALERGLQR